MVPFGQSALSGHSSKRTSTLSPSSAFNVLDMGTKISTGILLLSGTTKANFSFNCITPTYSERVRSIICVISPSCFPFFLRL